MALRMLLLAGVLAVVGGCGGGGGDEDSLETPDADTDAAALDLDGVETCSLISREEISEALGSEVGDGTVSGFSGCRWRAGSGASVRLQIFAGSLLADSTCESQMTLMTGREEDVPELGDSARWSSGGNLVVCSDRAVVSVDIDDTGNDPRVDRDVLLSIARVAIDRLNA